MGKVITMQEWADRTGRTLADVEAMAAEAESLGKLFDRNDPAACREHGWTTEAEAAFSRLEQKAKARASAKGNEHHSHKVS